MDYKVSILVPVYGVELYIKRCAKSLFEQTYENIEYIFVNDCSMDKSIDILMETIKSYPERAKQVRIINHNTNLGLGAARNTGVKNATGEFVFHVDSDDWIELDTIKEMVEVQRAEGADLVCGSYYNWYSDNSFKERIQNNTPKVTLLEKVLERQCITTIWNRLISKRLYDENNIHVLEGINQAEDYNVLPLLIYYSKKIAYLSHPTYYYNLSNLNSLCSNFNHNKLQQQDRVYDYLINFFSNNDMYLKFLYNGLLYSKINLKLSMAKKNEKELFYFIDNQIKRITEVGDSHFGFKIRIVRRIHNFYMVRFLLLISRILYNHE